MTFVDSTKRQQHIPEWVDSLQAHGHYSFSRPAGAALGKSDLAVSRGLARLVRAGRIAAPRRGFYVVVPLEHRATGAPPATWFVHDLMCHLGQPYYVGLLSAAALHGAAHQAAQIFQVVTDRPTRPADVGRVHIHFYKSAWVEVMPVVELTTETGLMRVSTPEATAFDLVRFSGSCGGLGNVATVLTELADAMRPVALVELAPQFELSVVQRTGFLLDFVGVGELAVPLAAWLSQQRSFPVALRPDLPSAACHRDPRWNVVVNEVVEVDL